MGKWASTLMCTDLCGCNSTMMDLDKWEEENLNKWGRTKGNATSNGYIPLSYNSTKDALNNFTQCYEHIMLLEVQGIKYDNYGI